MSAATFTIREHEEGSRRARDSHANLSSGLHLCLGATRATRLVDLVVEHGFMSMRVDFSPEQARDVAAELLACADALQGRA